MTDPHASNGEDPTPAPDTVGPGCWPETSTPEALNSIDSIFGVNPSVFLRDTGDPTADFASETCVPSSDSRLGRYKILGEINRGGMGIILKGRDKDLNRDLAIKVLLEKYSDSPGVLARFVEEAQIGGQLQHPGIVPVHDLGLSADNRPFFAMKLVKGETLSDLLKRRKSPREGRSENLRIFQQICETVAYAHSKGVIHRDLKPLNVMVGSFGEVQVMDWGLAKILDRKEEHEPRPIEPRVGVVRTDRHEMGSNPTHYGELMGTIAYMPPEQARGEIGRLDERADAFALGSILCEILTGYPAYRGRSQQEVVGKAAGGDLADALTRLGGCEAEPELIAIATTCLAPLAEDRPRDASQVARLISSYLSGVQERLRAAEIARVEETARAEEAIKRAALERSRRRRTLALAATSLVALGVFAIGLVVVIGLNRRLDTANANLRDSNAKLDRANADLGSALKSATEARSLAEDRKKAADENFTLALDAVKAQVFDITEQLENRPGTRDLREKLQKGATERLKSLIERTSRRSEVDHATIWAHFNLGDVYLQIDGKPTLAREQYERAFDLATKFTQADPRDALARRDLSISCENLGKVLLRVGETTQAKGFYRKALDVREALARADPRNAGAQRDLSVVYVKFGDVLLQTGEASQAMESFLKDLAICENLVRANPYDVQGKRDLSIAHGRLGDALLQAGEVSKAMDAYRKALAIGEALAGADPDDARTQRDLSVAHVRLGDVLLQAGEASEATEHYRSALALSEALAQADAHDARAQRDLAVAHGRFGDVLLQAGEASEATEHYRKDLALSEALAQADAHDAQAQRDLAVAHGRLGDVLLQAGEVSEAMEHYWKDQALSEALARADPHDAQAQRDLSISHNKLGDVFLQAGDVSKAMEHFQKDLALSEALANAAPGDAEARRDLSVSHVKLGDVLLQVGEVSKAIEYYRKATAVRESLAKRDPADALAQHDLKISRLKYRLALILMGDQKPVDNPERLELASQACSQKLYVASARLYAEAFDADPKLAEDLQAEWRIIAASSATLAGSGQGHDFPKPDEAAKAKLRAQAMDWLKAELAAWGKVAATDKPEDRATIARMIEELKIDADLAGIRDADALARLPEDERKAWQALWAEVDTLLKKANGS